MTQNRENVKPPTTEGPKQPQDHKREVCENMMQKNAPRAKRDLF